MGISGLYSKHSRAGGSQTKFCNSQKMRYPGHSDYKAMKPYIDVCDEIKAKAMKKFDDP